MSEMSKRELRMITEERDYWKKLADLVGWQLMGWTYKRGATYITPNIYGGQDTINMTGFQRDDLVKAIKENK